MFPPASYIILLLFSRDADHRYLHSFPTRRSSDLPSPKKIYSYSVGACNKMLQTNQDFSAEVKEHSSDFFRSRNEDRKSTRLNSSHVAISYAVFCLKKKKNNKTK